MNLPEKKTIGLITARGGSKGIPKKNIKLLAGRPLIYYTINAALNSKLDDVVVSTDCMDVARISKQYGAKVIMRPANLAEDDTKTIEVLRHVAQVIDSCFELIVTLQPTSPLRSAHHINEALNYFNGNPNVDSLVSVQSIPHCFHLKKLMTLRDGFLHGDSNYSRRQDHQKSYARNGAIYITSRSKLDNGIFSGNILPYYMDKFSSLDIDDMEDWIIVESIIKTIPVDNFDVNYC
jgi:CMP-N-acetylneuraminic acid synthetase